MFCHLLDIESNNNIKSNNRIYSKPLELKYKSYLEETNEKTENITLNDVVFPSESPFISKIIQAEESKEIQHELLNATFLGLYLIVFPIILTGYSYFHGKECNNYTLDIWSIIAICLAVNISQHIYLQYQNINYLRWGLFSAIFIFFAFFFAS